MFVRWWRQGLAGLVVVAVLAAFVLPASWWGPSAPPSQQLFEILVESKKAAELAKATAPERSGEFQAHGASRYGRQMIALAERYPKDPAAVEALILVVSRWGGHSPEADQAFQLLLNRQLNSPELMELIRAVPAAKPWRDAAARDCCGGD